MKTSEFIKKLEYLGLRVEKEVDRFEVFHEYDSKDYWFVIGDINHSNLSIQTGKFKVFRKEHIDVLNIVIEYINTPLEEREEEKKYRLKSKLIEFESERDLYLINSSLLKKYCLSTNIRQSFTQKEIDDMPFDTNFFIKEEVI